MMHAHPWTVYSKYEDSQNCSADASIMEASAVLFYFLVGDTGLQSDSFRVIKERFSYPYACCAVGVWLITRGVETPGAVVTV